MWYDFNLIIGDTLKNSAFSFDSTALMPPTIVTSIDSTLICGEYHKTFIFDNCSFGRLIEGMGFTSNFVNTSSSEMCYFEPTYMHSTAFSCTSMSVNETSNSSLNLIAIFPNPTINTLQINYTKQNIISPFEYSIMNCSGKVVCRGISNEDKGLDISKLNNGLYFLKLEDKQKQIFRSKFIKQ